MRSNITSFSVIFLLSMVAISNTMISDYSFQKGSMLFGYLDGKGGSYDGDGNIIVKNGIIEDAYQEIIEKRNTNLVKVASADTSIWGKTIPSNTPEENEDAEVTISSSQIVKADFSPMMVQGNSLVAPSSFYDANSDEQRYGIIKYTVENGDTPSSIATSFGVSTYTILWANNMKVGNYIKPGQVLEILPVTGVKHTATDKDTVESIATKYKAEAQEIITFNELPADGKLTAGRTLIIPNGEKEKPVEAPAPQTNTGGGTVVSSGKYVSTGTVKKGHTFPYGQCTWYVSTRFYVPWGGNAKTWLVNSRAYGYTTGKTPVPGAIVVTTEHRIYGHVGFIESVTPTTVTLSEMNYVGWARKSVRVLPRNSSVILGYIYPKE